MDEKKVSDERLCGDSELTDNEVKGRAVRGVAGLLTRQVLVRVIGFVGMLILARLLTPEMFGVFAIAQFVIVFFEQVAGMGLSAALLRKKAPPTEIELRTVFTIQQIAVLVAVGAIMGLAPVIVAHYDWDSSREALIRVLAAGLILASLKTIPSLLLQRQLRHDLIAVSEVVEYLVYQVIAITLAWLGYGVWALVVATLARGITGLVAVWSLARWRPAFGFNRAAAHEIWRFGIPLQMASLAGLASAAAVPVVVGSFMGTAAVGYANLARSVLDALVYQPLVIMGVVQFRVFSRFQDDRSRLIAVAERSMFLGGTLAILSAALVLALARPLVEVVLTDKWAPIISLLYILGPAYLIYVVSQPQVQVIKALGDGMSPLIAVIILAVTQLTLLTALAESMGLISYAMASAAGIAAAGLYIQVRIRKKMAIRLANNVGAPLLAALVGGAMAYMGQSIVHDVWGLVSGVCWGVVGYVITLMVLAGRRLGQEFTDVAAALIPKSKVGARV